MAGIGGNHGPSPTEGASWRPRLVRGFDAKDEEALVQVRMALGELQKNKKLTEAEVSTMSSCAKASFTANIMQDAMLTGAVYLLLTRLGKSYPAMQAQRTNLTLLAAVMGLQYFEDSRKDYCIKSFLGNDLPHAAELRQLYRTIHPDSSFLKLCEQYASRHRSMGTAAAPATTASVMGRFQSAMTVPQNLQPTAKASAAARDDGVQDAVESQAWNSTGNIQDLQRSDVYDDSSANSSSTFDEDAYFGRKKTDAHDDLRDEHVQGHSDKYERDDADVAPRRYEERRPEPRRERREPSRRVYRDVDEDPYESDAHAGREPAYKQRERERHARLAAAKSNQHKYDE